jgi:hypothetical protein
VERGVLGDFFFMARGIPPIKPREIGGEACIFIFFTHLLRTYRLRSRVYRSVVLSHVQLAKRECEVSGCTECIIFDPCGFERRLMIKPKKLLITAIPMTRTSGPRRIEMLEVDALSMAQCSAEPLVCTVCSLLLLWYSSNRGGTLQIGGIRP